MHHKRIILAANTDWYIYNFRKDLITYLLSKNYEIFAVSPVGDYVDKLKALGCAHIPWAVGRQTVNPIRELNSIRKLAKIYKRISPQIIHQHTLKAVIYGNIANRASKISVVNSIAGRGFVYSSVSLKANIIRPVLDLLLQYSMGIPNRQQVIFENRDDLTYFIDKKIIPQSEANLIRSVGVNIDKFKNLNVPPYNPFVVGYVGRMLWGKGVGTFVEAAKILSQRGHKIKMVMVGLPDPGNPDSVSNEELVSWNKQGVIEWWGWESDIAKVYQKIHTLVLPTTYGEGIPTVLLEAGASARALIATDLPLCQEVIEDGENGYLVPGNDPQTLANKIEALSKNKTDFDKIRLNAQKKIRESFSSQHVNIETHQIYQFLNL